MNACLQIEYFDTDASSYTHRVKLPLKAADSFRVGAANILEVEHADGTTRFIPLSNVRQYYAIKPDASSRPEASSQEHS